MKIIIRDSVKHFSNVSAIQNKKKNKNTEQQQYNTIRKYVENHPFYSKGLSISTITSQIMSKLKEEKNQKQDKLAQLGLYLKRQTNIHLFNVLQYILDHPFGVTYMQIAEKFNKIDIINASHYCCRLKKMKFIKWQHRKQGLLVFPSTETIPNDIESNQIVLAQNQTQKPFFFTELSVHSNLWVNVSSAETSLAGGISNEDIKCKILKHSQTKMIRKTMQNFQDISKVAERQGKVYEFKYKNQNEFLKKEMNKKKLQDESIQQLEPNIMTWLKSKFPSQKVGQLFLLNLINERLNYYRTILGVKQSKRQCTPLKLSRYIKLLNYIHEYGPNSQAQLRKFIVQYEKDMNIGKMHKRSLVGILEGLTNAEILKQIDGIYYPCWINQPQMKIKKPPNTTLKELKQPKKKKKIKLNEQFQEQRKTIKISHQRHRLELFCSFLVCQLDIVVKRIFKHAMRRIKNPHRKKLPNVYYEPLQHILFTLQQPQIKIPSPKVNSIESLMSEIDIYVKQNGITEQQIDLPQDIVKFFRINPFGNQSILKKRMGKQWDQKIESLSSNKLIKFDGLQWKTNLGNRFLI